MTQLSHNVPQEETINIFKVPNEQTLQAIANIENEQNLVKAKDTEDLFKKLDI